MIKLDKQAIQNLVILKRSPEFVTFMNLLEKSKIALALSNARCADDITCRWNQGRIQELDDILSKIKTSDEDLLAFREAPRKNIDI